MRAAPACAASCACPATSRSAIGRCILAALAAGESRIEGAGDGADVRSTAGIVARPRARRVERSRGDGRTVDYRVVSPGADGLREPAGVLDCGNSGTSLRLISRACSPACR